MKKNFKKQLFNEGSLLTWENLKVFPARAAAAVGEAATGREPVVWRRAFPCAFACMRGSCRMGSPRKGAGLQQVVLSSRFESCESRRDFRTTGGFLPTQKKWGVAEVGKRCQVVLGKGAVVGTQGTAKKDSLLMHWLALPSPLLSPEIRQAGSAQLPPGHKQVRELSQHNTQRNCSELEEAAGLQRRDCCRQPAKQNVVRSSYTEIIAR